MLDLVQCIVSLVSACILLTCCQNCICFLSDLQNHQSFCVNHHAVTETFLFSHPFVLQSLTITHKIFFFFFCPFSHLNVFILMYSYIVFKCRLTFCGIKHYIFHIQCVFNLLWVARRFWPRSELALYAASVSLKYQTLKCHFVRQLETIPPFMTRGYSCALIEQWQLTLISGIF